MKFIQYKFTNPKFLTVDSHLSNFPQKGDDIVFGAHTLKMIDGVMNMKPLCFEIVKVIWEIGAETGINTIFILTEK